MPRYIEYQSPSKADANGKYANVMKLSGLTLPEEEIAAEMSKIKELDEIQLDWTSVNPTVLALENM